MLLGAKPRSFLHKTAGVVLLKKWHRDFSKLLFKIWQMQLRKLALSVAMISLPILCKALVGRVANMHVW